MNIAILTVSNRPKFLEWTRRQVQPLIDKFHVQHIVVQNPSTIGAGRNECLRRACGSDIDWAIWRDDDTWWHPDLYEELVRAADRCFGFVDIVWAPIEHTCARIDLKTLTWYPTYIGAGVPMKDWLFSPATAVPFDARKSRGEDWKWCKQMLEKPLGVLKLRADPSGFRMRHEIEHDWNVSEPRGKATQQLPLNLLMGDEDPIRELKEMVYGE